MAWRLLRAWKLRTPSHIVPPSATSWSNEYFVGSCLTSQYPRPIASGSPPKTGSRCEGTPRPPPPADAHGDDAPALAAALQLEQQRAGHARAGHAVGMADRDRAAVGVELIQRDAEPVAAV